MTSAPTSPRAESVLQNAPRGLRATRPEASDLLENGGGKNVLRRWHGPGQGARPPLQILQHGRARGSLDELTDASAKRCSSSRKGTGHRTGGTPEHISDLSGGEILPVVEHQEGLIPLLEGREHGQQHALLLTPSHQRTDGRGPPGSIIVEPSAPSFTRLPVDLLEQQLVGDRKQIASKRALSPEPLSPLDARQKGALGQVFGGWRPKLEKAQDGTVVAPHQDVPCARISGLPRFEQGEVR